MADVAFRSGSQAAQASILSRTWDLSRLSFGDVAGRIAFFALAAMVLAVGTVYLLLAINLVDKPFPGFFVNKRLVLTNTGRYHWTGIQAGLKFPDKILMVDNKPVSSDPALLEAVRNRSVGQPVRYSIEREGRVFEIAIPTMLFVWSDLLLTFGIQFLSGVVYFLIGAIVFILKPDTRVSWTFFLACFFLSLYTITAFDLGTEYWTFIRINLLVNTFFPAAFLHLSLVFPEKKKIAEKYPFVEALPYILSTALIVPIEILYPNDSFIAFYKWVRIYTILAALSLPASVVQTFFKRSSPLARQRSKVLLFGAALAFPIPAFASYVSLFWSSLVSFAIQNNFLAVPIILFPASIAYAITRHNLFDVDVYIKRSVGYGIMTALVAVGYFALQTLATTLVIRPVFGEYGENVYPLLFALMVVFLFNPINRRVQDGVDRLFFRMKFDYKETVSSVSNALTTLMSVDEVLRQIIGTLRGVMFVDNAGVIVLDRKRKSGESFFVADEEESGKEVQKNIAIGFDDPLVQLLYTDKRLITRYDIEEDPRYRDLRESCGRSFSEMGGSLAVPLLFQGEVSGALVLGNKKSGHFFSRDDVDLLSTMANASAVALENAKLFQENLAKARMEEELKIAHDIQMSMLPDRAPAIVGLKIAARSIPAREVGGDFYDFIEIRGDGRTGNLGIVIGDVSGKGVSAALLMAASRSIYRVLAEAHPTVEEIMSIANARLNRDIKKGMFVALLYAVLDPMEKTLTISNAGQTQPILCPGDASNPFYIDTEGDKFPLGIVKDCQYQGTCVQLKEGDIVVFYTDGVVEAINDKEELYGFDRFMASISERRELDADALLEKLIEHVQRYVGNVEQHDDITLVVVRVER